MIERAQTCTLLVDHSKLGNLGLEADLPADRRSAAW